VIAEWAAVFDDGRKLEFMKIFSLLWSLASAHMSFSSGISFSSLISRRLFFEELMVDTIAE
jgi:hypothetical protein